MGSWRLRVRNYFPSLARRATRSLSWSANWRTRKKRCAIILHSQKCMDGMKLFSPRLSNVFVLSLHFFLIVCKKKKSNIFYNMNFPSVYFQVNQLQDQISSFKTSNEHNQKQIDDLVSKLKEVCNFSWKERKMGENIKVIVVMVFLLCLIPG